MIVRLFSMLHAVALAEIEDANQETKHDIEAFGYELIDGLGLDKETLAAVKASDS